MKTLVAMLLLAASLTGCAVYTPSGSLVLNPGEAGVAPSSGGHSFCPPGLAKQGRC